MTPIERALAEGLKTPGNRRVTRVLKVVQSHDEEGMEEGVGDGDYGDAVQQCFCGEMEFSWWKTLLLVAAFLGGIALLVSIGMTTVTNTRARSSLEPVVDELIIPSFTENITDLSFLEPARSSTPPFLTLLASRDPAAIARFRTSQSDVVLFDYSADGSTECDWCVYVMRTRGVKWELLVRSPSPTCRLRHAAESASCQHSGAVARWHCRTGPRIGHAQDIFFEGSWWRQNKEKYRWMWYPDDDLVLKPGEIDQLFNLVGSSSTFYVVQLSLCPGSQISHPTMEQTYPHDPEPIIHMYSVELQQPLGLVSWWDELATEGVFSGQTFGFGIDTVWTDSVGNERHTGLVNAICAQHPHRHPGHKSGRDDSPGFNVTGAPARVYPTFHEIVQANVKKFKYDQANDFFYRSHRHHRAGKGNCHKACKEDGVCLGVVALEDCNLPETLPSVNATLPGTEAYCLAETVAEVEGKLEQLCCVCLEEDPYWRVEAPTNPSFADS